MEIIHTFLSLNFLKNNNFRVKINILQQYIFNIFYFIMYKIG